MKKVIFWTIYNIVVVLVILSLVEIGIRVFSENIVTQSTDENILAEGRFGLTPGLKPLSVGEVFSKGVKVDERGFLLNKCFSKKKRKKILFFGDSVTMGVGVDADSSFAARMQNYYCDSLDIDNLSLIGYNINDYLRIAETLQKENTLDTYDEVLVFFCLNDNFLKSAVQNSVNGSSTFSSAMEWFKGKSYTYIAVKGMVTDRSKAHYDFDKQLYSNQELLKNLEAKIVDLHQKLGNKLKFVLLPYEFQFREDYSKENYPQKVLSDLLNKHAIRYVDAGTFFTQDAEAISDFYLYADGIHFSNHGHRFLSSALIENKVLLQ